jgi:hypothetical protein
VKETQQKSKEARDDEPSGLKHIGSSVTEQQDKYICCVSW